MKFVPLVKEEGWIPGVREGFTCEGKHYVRVVLMAPFIKIANKVPPGFFALDDRGEVSFCRTDSNLRFTPQPLTIETD